MDDNEFEYDPEVEELIKSEDGEAEVKPVIQVGPKVEEPIDFNLDEDEEFHLDVPEEAGKDSGAVKDFAAVINHGQAMDHSEGARRHANRSDPELTEDGMTMAKATGRFLKKYFEENNYKFKRVIVECSPFLSCMQTAA